MNSKVFFKNQFLTKCFQTFKQTDPKCLIIATKCRFSQNREESKKQSFITSRFRLKAAPVYDPTQTSKFVKVLKQKDRENLFHELNKYQESNGESTKATITRSQLNLLFTYHCAPFIGFGFLDNAIMILAGEYIDVKIGATLGITTMAAAALGNLISDLAGIGLAGYVELLCCKLGLPTPDLTPAQLELSATRIVSNFGKAVGIVIGCIIGMFPLLLIKDRNQTTK
ncbi:transmembrane protein 65-like [Ciona intestinalis]